MVLLLLILCSFFLTAPIAKGDSPEVTASNITLRTTLSASGLLKPQTPEGIKIELTQSRDQEEKAAQAAEQARLAALARPARQVIKQVSAPPSSEAHEALKVATIATWDESQWPAMETLINNESGFNMYAHNPTSGACGLFQALPCSKMGGMGLDNQVNWGVGYIAGSYGTPKQALAFWYCTGMCRGRYKTGHWY